MTGRLTAADGWRVPCRAVLLLLLRQAWRLLLPTCWSLVTKSLWA